jgi:hypothetical protein
MNEEARNTPEEAEADRPVPIIRGPLIAQVLGRIDVEGHKPIRNPSANNTRWVFDVHTKEGKPLVVYLLDYRSGRREFPDLMSFGFTPTNQTAYKAQPVIRDEEGVLHIETLPTDEAATFRVFVDVMHTATR